MSTNLNALLLSTGVCLAIASGSAFADELDQLAASAGLEPSEIEELTLTEVAAYKFSRDTSGGPTTGIEPGRSSGTPERLATSAGLSADEAAGMSLTVISAYFFNRGSSDEDQQTTGGQARVTKTSRSAGASQLALSAGLTEVEAQDLSLRQIAAHAFNHGASPQDWQRTDLR